MPRLTPTQFTRHKTRRAWQGRAFHALCLLAVCASLTMLAILLTYLATQGYSRLSWDFLTAFPSRFPEKAGIQAALLGSIYVVTIAGLTSFTLGVAAAIYLEEYAGRSPFARIARINIANLAGVPSIVYGLLGLEIFVRMMDLGRSVLAGGLTLALLVLPIIIVAAGEAIRAVPPSPARRRLRPGRHPLASNPPPSPTPSHARHPDRRNPGRIPRHRRNRPPDRHGRPNLRPLRPRRPPKPLHRPTHPNLQLDPPAPNPASTKPPPPASSSS